MKKILTVIIALAATVSVIGIGTYAYTTTEKQINGTVTSSNLKCELHDVDETGKEISGSGIEYDMIPGSTIKRIVYVENAGTEPMYVRLSLDKAVAKASVGQLVDTDTLKRAQNNLEDVMRFDFDTANWTFKDGYFYFNRPISSGATTTPLFTEIGFDGQAMGNDYRGLRMGLRVNAETVQSRNNGSSALTAAGWE